MPRKHRVQPQSPVAGEIGTVRKSWKNRFSVALAYPNTYGVGMSSLGFQSVYRLFNNLEHVVCERVFAPEDGRLPLRTLESGRRPAEADLLAFSVSFENDYPNLLAMISRSGLPLRAEDRKENDPLVAAGGVACMLNPEPIAPFVDVFLVGEAEQMINALVDAAAEGGSRRRRLLRIAQQVPGAYVPSFYRVRHHRDGTLAAFEPTEAVPSIIRRAYAPDVAGFSTCSAVIAPETAFAGRFLIEVSRGCPHGCRFCSAGFIYRPPRFRPLQHLEADLRRGADQTGRIGLVGAAVSDLPGLDELCRSIEGTDLQISFSSLRADALTPALISTLAKSGVKTATLAPDAGSQRLRDVINKGIDEETVLAAAEALVAAGILNLKLYFMVGLPTETTDDIEAIVTLCKRIKHRFLSSSRARGRIGAITVSLNSFVPKPFTPFQWAAMEEVPRLKQKLRTVKDGLRQVANVRVHADVPRWAAVQGLLARGDRRVAEILALVHDEGGNWPRALKMSPINPDFYLLRDRNTDERFPWDFIDHGVRRAFLLREYRRALCGEPSAPCCLGQCTACGVCPKNASM
ncbi:MAG: TIGR03960 family B12-binding radical SAM protein [Desulfobacterales bacterium]|nr:TIGR03960 family B12-binding radical SAM protein [Desulfobacterales bacterium]